MNSAIGLLAESVSSQRVLDLDIIFVPNSLNVGAIELAFQHELLLFVHGLVLQRLENFSRKF